ncbi:hypothetical protein ACWEX2_13570 [Staphylococcus xylosus]|uniref:Uncharacterized protein n=1 Tax=Staphylococcus xylosus TaxID=1288 RepID=A0AAQ0RWS3_STAXY|nr:MULTISPECIES: hypothetical protein [Staphylococcus]RIL88128.1 hypothetical protein BUY32_11805 [Staphylococcus cohnii]RIM64091.1 hypothetical protein BU122_12165 [Staphylococcus xylosus]RIM90654.1 hypothetical protein BU104_13605 [Staphylococcus xylosus]
MSINTLLTVFAVISLIVYVFICINVAKDTFLDIGKKEKEQKKSFIKFFIPFSIVLALIVILINIYVFPYLLVSLK